MHAGKKKKMGHTLVMIVQGGVVLLGMKKRGFGKGRWNGFGGKVKPGESIKKAAAREIREEVGLRVSQLEKAGRIDFEFQGKEEILRVHVFTADNFSGEPIETAEMKPRWFQINEIPYPEMWPDDKYWLPLMLAGKKFKGAVLFGPADRILRKKLAVVKK